MMGDQWKPRQIDILLSPADDISFLLFDKDPELGCRGEFVVLKFAALFPVGPPAPVVEPPPSLTASDWPVFSEPEPESISGWLTDGDDDDR